MFHVAEGGSLLRREFGDECLPGVLIARGGQGFHETLQHHAAGKPANGFLEFLDAFQQHGLGLCMHRGQENEVVNGAVQGDGDDAHGLLHYGFGCGHFLLLAGFPCRFCRRTLRSFLAGADDTFHRFAQGLKPGV